MAVHKIGNTVDVSAPLLSMISSMDLLLVSDSDNGVFPALSGVFTFSVVVMVLMWDIEAFFDLIAYVSSVSHIEKLFVACLRIVLQDAHMLALMYFMHVAHCS